ncbi:type VI secretion system tube protein Hcp [Erwinia endophytica]|uniref:Hcp family type VI secretion system effector n=1 Tax=Erwinia endophytica TaxID=1563158 RepID=UPI0012660406|nr:type VI secretion system tube protein TssD [Erwinia endophytica]KAB8306707.1 type VI secretion system tube protein Hcp [Erwinia endophytica]
MAIPVYLWLYDGAGNLIKGSVDIIGREHSIEVIALRHSVEIPTDDNTGKITGSRIHQSFSLDKEIDSSSPYIYKALTTGENLKNAEFKYYRINNAGQEENYFTVTLENIKIESNISLMYDIKDSYGENKNHLECIDLGYEKITWHYVDGNIIHSDSWNYRSVA